VKYTSHGSGRHGRKRLLDVIAVTQTAGRSWSMELKKRIGFLAFDDFQALDLVGPADAFGSDAMRDQFSPATDREHHRPYEIVVIGLTGKKLVSSAGLSLLAHVGPDTRMRFDTLIVPGGAGLRRPGVGEKAVKWITSRAPGIRRIASVCTGLYGLAPTGLLDGRTVTTHWSAVDDIRKRYPKLEINPDAIFIKSGKFYTSAGITAGIDLALALIEEDLGPDAALAVAREMIVYFKRPGGQNQFSEPLKFQVSSSDRFKNLAAWIHSHLEDDLSVEALAARTFLSVRQFRRAFKEEIGVNPATFVEEARLAEASRRLAASRRRVNIEGISRSVGYRSADVFRRAFERRFRVTPANYRSRFGSGLKA
jgi:transcriptional regulator GlxA family with amidase domain